MPTESETPAPAPETNTATPDPRRGKLSPRTIEELVGLVRAPKTVAFILAGQTIELRVRALSEDEWAQVNKIGEGLRPPYKYEDKAKTRPLRNAAGEVQYDEEDEEFRRKSVDAYERRMTAAISQGLVDMELPGADMEAKHEWRRKSMSPQLCAFLYAAIRQITTDPMELAHFSTGAS